MQLPSLPVKITNIILDMDGVLTDGTVLVLENGVQARRMHVRDGYALQLAVKKGYKLAIVSGGNYAPAIDRLNKLGITDVYMGITDKKTFVLEYLAKNKLLAAETLFMGDDMPDLAIMQLVGLPVCPADAVEEIKAVARYLSPVRGGEGCVRDVLEKIMKQYGDWGEEEGIASR